MKTDQKATATLEFSLPIENAIFHATQTEPLRYNTDQLAKLFMRILSARRKISAPILAQLLSLRGDMARPLIEARSGHAISSAAAAERLKVSDETIRARVKKNKLIGYFASDENRKLRLPEWQFSGPHTVHVWVQPLIEAFGENGWALLDFMSIPRTGMVADTEFNGESLLQSLQAGNADVVITAAQRANPT